MRFGIEINGVLRNTLGKIEQTYEKFYHAKLFISFSEIACLKIAMFIWGAKSVNRY